MRLKKTKYGYDLLIEDKAFININIWLVELSGLVKFNMNHFLIWLLKNYKSRKSTILDRISSKNSLYYRRKYEKAL